MDGSSRMSQFVAGTLRMYTPLSRSLSIPTLPLCVMALGCAANIKELLKTGALIKILQEEKTHTRTFDEKPVLITGPTNTVREVQKAVCER